LVVRIGHPHERQAGGLRVDREHPNRTATKIGYHDAATIGGPGKTDPPPEPALPAPPERRSPSFLQATLSLHPEDMYAASALKHASSGKAPAGRAELDLRRAFSRGELDGRARNGSETARLVDVKPRDVWRAGRIRKRHGLVCDVDDVIADGQAHWMRAAGRKRRTDDRLQATGRNDLKDGDRVAAGINGKKIVAMNAQRALRVQ